LAVVGLGCPSLRRFVGGCVLLLAIVGILIHATQYRWFAIPSVKAIDSAMIIDSQSWFDEAYADGVRLYVMHAVKWGSCEPWAKTEPQLAMALKAGMKIAVYTRNPKCWENGILAAGALREHLQFFAIDIETDPGVPATAAMVSGVQAMGVRPVIYSGSAMWQKIMGEHLKEFSAVPLWDGDARPEAHSKWVSDVLSPPPVAYGGWNTFWNMRIGVQQAFEYTMHGVPVDLNSFDGSFLR
jgi:hypothetical protein